MRTEGLPARLLRQVLVAPSVLFVCVGNAGRSVMAEAIFNASAPPGWTAISAGTEPAERVNPRTAPMLAEIGLALPDHPPQRLTNEMIDGSPVRITMGCLDRPSCPARLRNGELLDWELPDPARLDDDGFRSVRDEIRRRVAALQATLAERADAR